MKLRTHHLLCMPMYQGHGYSEEYCLHMAQIIEQIRNSEEEIEVLTSPDVVCSHCPHLNKESVSGKAFCDKEGIIAKKDQNLLKAFGIEKEKNYTRDILKQTVLKNMKEDEFMKSCHNCDWLKQGLCNYDMWKEKFPKLF